MRRLACVAAVVLAASPAYADAGASGDTDETVSNDGELVPLRLTAKLAGTRMQLDVRFAFTAHTTPNEREPYQVFLPSGGAITGAVVSDGTHVERLRLDNTKNVETTWDALLAKP